MFRNCVTAPPLWVDSPTPSEPVISMAVYGLVMVGFITLVAPYFIKAVYINKPHKQMNGFN